MRLVDIGYCALVLATLVGSGLDSRAAQTKPRITAAPSANHLTIETWSAEIEPAHAGGKRLLAAAGAEGPGTLQIDFFDGSSMRLGPASLAKLDGFARAAGGANDGSDPALKDGIVRLRSGRLRRLPVLLSGERANAHASLAVYAAMKGNFERARSALDRAKVYAGDMALRSQQEWASVTRAHVTLAEAQLLDLDGRHEEAESLYRAGLEAIIAGGDAVQNGSPTGAPDDVADVQVLLSAELSRSLAQNLAVQGRRTESQVAARQSLRTYVERFGHAPAYASGSLKLGAESGFTQVAVSQMPRGAVVSQMLITGLLIVTAIDPDAVKDNVKDARGDPKGTPKSPGPADDDSNVREPSGTPGGTPRSSERSGDNGNTKDARGEAGGTSRSSDGSGDNGNTKDARGGV